MITLDKAVIARYKKGELHFEALVDPDLSRELKQGKEVELDDVIAASDIYTDSSKAKKAPEEELIKAFGTTDYKKVIPIIIQKGEIQLTTEQKHKMQEERKRQILHLISRSAVDPRTHMPHPLQRLEKVFEETRHHVDIFKSAEAQVDEVLAKMKKILPIKMETDDIAVRVPAIHAGRAVGYLHSLKRLKEQWMDDGSYYCMIELPAGLKSDFEDKLNKITHGEAEYKVIERK